MTKNLLFLSLFMTAAACTTMTPATEPSRSRQPSSVRFVTGDQLVAFLEKLPPSYAFRSVCANQSAVIGRYSTAKHWSDHGKDFLAYGDTNQFPASTVPVSDSEKKAPFKMEYPTGPDDWGRFPILKSKAAGTEDEIRYARGSIEVKGQEQPADCAFESGARLE